MNTQTTTPPASRSTPVEGVETYLFFPDCTEEAIEFYRTTLGATVEYLLRFKDNPDSDACVEGSGENIMHATLRIGNSTIMASDCAGESEKFGGFSLTLHVSGIADAERYFQALSEGGEIKMPLGKTFWSPCFGVVLDRFGISWMVHVAP